MTDLRASRAARRHPKAPRDPSVAGDDAILPGSARARFRDADRGRAEREQRRLEGTPQRALFRELRERFLLRHSTAAAWAVDVGAGPGRYTGLLGGPGTRRVAFDLSRAMLEALARPSLPPGEVEPIPVERVRGDLLRPPFAAGRFGEVVAIGNPLGFAEESADSGMARVESLVAEEGVLIVEIAPAGGERSNYLGRLPPGATQRLLSAPVAALLPRVAREGFRVVAPRRSASRFHRFRTADLLARWASNRWSVQETMSVAPCLGADPDRIAAVARDPKAWAHLLALEEEVGRSESRWVDAAAVLLAAQRTRPSAH